MKITHTQNEAATACTVTVEVERGDYAPEAEKRLREQRAKANTPGFRKGMVPLELVRRMYAPAIELDVVQGILGQELYKYLQEQGIKSLGDPTPANEDPKREDGGFTFVFDVVLSPSLSFRLDKGVSVPYYKREVSETFVDEQIGLLRRLFAERKEKEGEGEGDGKGSAGEAGEEEKPAEVAQAELNQAFFDRIFGAEAVSDEEGFRAKVRERLAEAFETEPDYRFLSDLRRQVIEEMGHVPLADDLLKRRLTDVRKTEKSGTAEEEYPSVREDIVRQLVDAELYHRAGITTPPEEIIRQAERTSVIFFAQSTGCYLPPLSLVQQYAQGVLTNKENIERMTELAADRLLIAWLKEQVTVEMREEAKE
ncbi:MAG: trigger factor family protein [Tannerellaceae bacterium]|jgi:FKBP-type peptidyl-prolyl cis-trans isomerase (trigger factor)|nr:trigger factor family protein [Tannerellaceae bacterium]